MNWISSIFNWSRIQKFWVSLTYDIIIIIASLLGASYVRLENISLFDAPPGLYALIASVISAIIVLKVSGVYRTVIRFSGMRIGQQIAIASAVSAATLVITSFVFSAFMPRTVPVIYLILVWCGMALPRYLLRSVYYRLSAASRMQVAIYGAGSAGRQVFYAMQHGSDHTPILFLDDDSVIEGALIQNIRVYKPDALPDLIQKYGLKKVILALPAINRETRRNILERLEPLPVEILTIPNLSDILSGKSKIDDVHHVEIEDLLGRSSVAPNQALLTKNIWDKSVFVSGAGGSIGSELCRQILKSSPKRMVLFEQNEFALYQVEQEFSKYILENNLKVELVPILGSVQHYKRLVSVFRRFNIETIYHAAAYKHVPLVEYNVIEGVRNNVFGTYLMVKAAVDCNIDNFVLISTDKAVRPTNIMGATKRVAELICQAYAGVESCNTNFAMVRFGNVLGSSGSVVPLFRKQIAAGGPITVTDPEITRYFMTIPEAAQLVIQAGAMAHGGDVFVLDMGEPVKITDLAERMIRLSGLTPRNESNPTGDIEISFTGLRPGEKLYEELLIGDNVVDTQHDRIMKAHEVKLTLSELSEFLDKIDHSCHEFEVEEIWRILVEMPLGFSPVCEVVDLVAKTDERAVKL